MHEQDGPDQAVLEQTMSVVLRFLKQDDREAASSLLLGIRPETALEIQWREVEEEAIDAFFAKQAQSIAPEPSILGSIVDGRYRICEQIGSGGMGTVYVAREKRLDRFVAIKFIRSDQKNHANLSERFECEASHIATLQHPSIVAVHAYGLHEGTPYFVMEFVPGRSLKEIASSEYTQEERAGLEVPVQGSRSWCEWSARVIADVASALSHCHGRGVEHRDVKPGNIIVDRHQRPRLVDFGLAKRQGISSVTRNGELLGTLPFLSPGRLNGHPEDFGQGDVWGLAVTLFNLLSGRLPFDTRSESSLIKSITEGRAASLKDHLPQAPKALTQICRKALSRRPRDRYTSSGAFEEDLRRFLAGRPLAASGAGIAVTVRTHLVEFRWRYFTIIGIGALMVTAVFAMRNFEQRSIWTKRNLVTAEVKRSEIFLATPAQNFALLRDLEAWVEEGTGQNSDQERCREIVGWIRSGAERERTTGRAIIAKGRQSNLESSEAWETPSQARLLKALQSVVSAELLLNPNASGDAWRDYLPSLTISVRAAEGVVIQRVSVFELGPVTGLPGRTPMIASLEHEAGGSIPQGRYLIVVEDHRGRHAEFSRHILADSDILVREQHFRFDEATMVHVQGREVVFGDPSETSTVYRQRKIVIPSFLIDRCEVTCAEYKVFMDAHQYVSRPKSWTTEYEPEWADLPVAGVSWVHAMQYCEWIGKRLPSLAEWHLAARGGNMAPFPWGQSAEGMSAKSVVGRGVSTPLLRGVSPVGSHSGDCSPCGALDMFGNVSEWVDTPMVDFVNRQAFSNDSKRGVCGNGWSSPPMFAPGKWNDLNFFSEHSAHNRSVGFRCARSLRKN
ncbi:MAG: bifunctional serine/threonine-protein kinase/formylglycine-generating enzyme family protein [Planctomycetota bacterium]